MVATRFSWLPVGFYGFRMVKTRFVWFYGCNHICMVLWLQPDFRMVVRMVATRCVWFYGLMVAGCFLWLQHDFHGFF